MEEILCTDEYHVPTSIVQQRASGSWWLFCDCQTERCGNVRFTDADEAERWAYGSDIRIIQPLPSLPSIKEEK